MKRMLAGLTAVAIVFASAATMVNAAPPAKTTGKVIGVNVVLEGDITGDRVAALEVFGRVLDRIEAIDALTMRAREADLDAIRSLPFVKAANPDAERNGAPVDTVAVTDFGDGVNTWDLDAVNVTDYGAGRTIDYDGSGVYVAVLDTGLLDSWRRYFPEERIAVQFAKSFGGGGGEAGNVSEQPNKWEHDQNSHGTHVTSTVLGYQMPTRRVNGVAPLATVIPVKVLNQNGSGWSSAIARGIAYVADLKASGALGESPVVINMSLGGSVLDAVEQVAIDYAISKGVIIVASAGNRGEAGMGYPGAYAPVISSAASGWVGEWTAGSWWRTLDVADPTIADDMYIADFSSRELVGQDLDVAAPGSWIVGPYQVNSGNRVSYYYLGGTSMAAPHVAGIVALMAQKDPGLTAAEAEAILEGAAIPLPAGCRFLVLEGDVCWGDDATGAGLITADAALALTP